MTKNIWTLSPDDRLREWRSFRKQTSTLGTEQQLESVITWWKMAPLGTRVIDIYNSNDWPDPWELIYKGEFDENAIALGMAYSIQLLEKQTELCLLQDRTDHFLGLIVLVDKTYILNYTYGIIEDATKVLDNSEIVQSWNVEDLIKHK